MSITLTLGWWLIPAIITIIVFIKWGIYTLGRESGGDYDFGVDVLLGLLVAAVVSMFSWTIYLGIALLLKP